MLPVPEPLTEVVVTAPLEVDISSAPRLAQDLARACALHPDRVVVDFSGSTFCDSSAVEVLLDAAEALRSAGCELQIRPNPLLIRIAAVLQVSHELRLGT